MNLRQTPLNFLLYTVLYLTLVASCSTLDWLEPGPTFSFAVISDPYWGGENPWEKALTEIRTMDVNPEPQFRPAEFIMAVGDTNPTEDRYRDYLEAFAGDPHMKAFLPVMGNHDVPDREFMVSLVSTLDSTALRDSEYVNYYTDWENVALIVVDGYSDLGADGVINNNGRDWG